MLPVAQVVECLVRPKVRSARLLPLSRLDGAVELRVLGLNFHSAATIVARVGGQTVVAALDSPTELSFQLNTLSPGRTTFAVEMNGRSLATFTTCVTYDILVRGGELSDAGADASCGGGFGGDHAEAASAFAASLLRRNFSSQREIRSVLPRSGLTVGSTPVEIIVDGINFNSRLTCSFAGTEVDAMVIDIDRVVCHSPHLPPQNASLTLNSTDGAHSWCCGWFFYHPVLKLQSITPSVLDRRGGTIMVVSFQHPLLQAQRLHCHFGSMVVPAHIIGELSVSCVAPALHVSTVQVSIGSADEEWSDALTLPVSAVQQSVAVLPARGSVEGGTNVTVHVPDGAAMVSPVCFFNATKATSVYRFPGAKALSCVSPPGELGNVDITVIDERHMNSPEFFVGTFTYGIAADVASLAPTFINQGKSLDVACLWAPISMTPAI